MKTTLREELNTDCGTESQSTQVTNHGLSRMSTGTIINNTDSSSVLPRACVVVKRGLINTGHPDTHKYTPRGEEGDVEAKTKLYLTSSTCGLHFSEWACIPPLTRTRQTSILQSLNPCVPVPRKPELRLLGSFY